MISDDMSFSVKGQVNQCSIPNTPPNISLQCSSTVSQHLKVICLNKQRDLKYFKNSSISLSEKSEIS